MPHCFGQRARTRDLFARPFRRHGPTPLGRLMLSYHKGEYVDVIADGSVQKGIPHKFYHGKTGKVFDITKHAIGVIINKKVGNRLIPKRIHVRVEHVRKSKSREAFRDRVRANDLLKREAKAKGERVNTKRTPRMPREERIVEVNAAIEYVNPIKFRELY